MIALLTFIVIHLCNRQWIDWSFPIRVYISFNSANYVQDMMSLYLLSLFGGSFEGPPAS